MASLALAVLLCSCDLYREAFSHYIMDATYASMDEVRADNAIVRGWIPEHLPPSARDIKERHSGDTNEGWGAFAFEDWGRDALATHWREVPAAPSPRDLNRFSEAPKVDWWPAGFGDGFAYYRGLDDSDFWLAVDLSWKVGYFWQGP